MNLTETSCCNTGACTPPKSETLRTLRPVVYTRHEESGVRLSVALPGVRKYDLKLTVHDGLLAIDASRADKDDCVRYSLSIKLADRLDGGRTAAALEDGVLNLRIPLREEALPQQVAIA